MTIPLIVSAALLAGVDLNKGPANDFSCFGMSSRSLESLLPSRYWSSRPSGCYAREDVARGGFTRLFVKGAE